CDTGGVGCAALEVRQAVLRALEGSEPMPIGKERLLRYVRDARGLEREDVLAGLRDLADPSPELIAAAAETLLTDPDERADVHCALFLAAQREYAPLRRAAVTVPHVLVRCIAIDALGGDPAD